MTDSPVDHRRERRPETANEARRSYEPSIDTSFSDSDGLTDHERANGEYDTTYYDPADVERDLKRLRPDDAERTSWGYIGSLCAIFVLLCLAAWACDDSAEDVPELRVEEGGESAPATAPMRLSASVLGDIVTLTGSVPDEATKAEVLAAAESVYAAENIIDQLTVVEGTITENGSINVGGQALQDDERPAALRDALVDNLDLSDGGLAVERSASALLPSEVEGAISPVEGQAGAVRVVLSGVVPDEESRNQLQAAAVSVWGANAVDVSALTVGERTWDQGRIRLAGTVPAGDARHESFPNEVAARLSEPVAVDVSGVSVDEEAVTLEDVEEQITVKLEAQAILFAPESAEIEPASDGVISEIVDLLQTIPDASIEVVGHTDDVGPDDENLALSQARADAVVARLVELGVDDARLNSRGEGEAQPLVPNEDDESRARNRRIEFNLIRSD